MRELHELPPDMPELMTAAEVAGLFRVDRKTPTRWAKKGRLASVRTPGGHLRFPRSGVETALRNGFTPHVGDGA